MPLCQRATLPAPLPIGYHPVTIKFPHLTCRCLKLPDGMARITQQERSRAMARSMCTVRLIGRWVDGAPRRGRVFLASSDRPRIYQQMKAAMPAYVAALENIGSMLRAAGPLDERTIQLIQIAASAGIRSEGAVHSHTRRALEAGRGFAVVADEVRKLAEQLCEIFAAVDSVTVSAGQLQRLAADLKQRLAGFDY